MKILNKLNINLKIKNIILITLLLTSISITTLFTIPVQACQNVGTYEENFKTRKNSYMLGDSIYGKGTDDYEKVLQLRLQDPNNNFVFSCGPETGTEIRCSWRLYDYDPPGKWNIQLGEYYDYDWHWVKISYFDVLAPSEYTLSVQTEGNGAVIKDPDQKTYAEGAVVELTAIPDTCWAFNYWSDDLNSYNNPETITMDGNKIVTAHFYSEAYYLLTINLDGNGWVDIDPLLELYECETLVDLTANANPGWVFNYWSGDLSSSNDFETINMTSNKNICAHFYEESNNGEDSNGEHPNSGSSSSGSTSTRGKASSKNLPPVANLSASEPYQGFVNSEITFNGSLSYDPDGHVVSWIWDFGDGNSGEGEIVTHSYSNTGMYNVLLTVTDDKGAANDSEISLLVIQLNNPPSNSAINGPSWGTKAIDYTYYIVSTDDDNDSIKYIIDWGDGDIDESEFLPNGTIFMITHKWKSVGSYTIKATANDNQTVSSSEIVIIINEPAPEEDNFLLFFLALLALILIIIMILRKRVKDKK
jgi:hypothetical protein